jgi:hypothetical protein
MLLRFIIYCDIFLFTFAVGLNTHTAIVWTYSEPERHYCGG